MAVPPLSIRGIYGSLRAPALRDLVYALKAFAASALALMVGFSLNLENPYWSVLTVYIIVNPPGAGAIRAKCLFRLAGTVLGGVLVVAATGLFGDQIGVLLAAMIAIIAGAMFLNQIEKTPKSYIWFAVAVTAAVIALSNLMHPDRIFDLATARAGEISIGILMTAAVDCVWPEPMTPAFLKTMAIWHRAAGDFATDTIQPAKAALSNEVRQSKLHDLIKGIQAIDLKAVQLPFDVVPRAPRRRDLDLVLRQVVATVGDLIAMELYARPFRETRVISSQTGDVLRAVALWVRDMPSLSSPELDAHAGDGLALAGDLAAARDGLNEAQGRLMLMERGFLTHLAAFVHDWCDLSLALRAVETGQRLPPRLDHVAAHATPVRSIDYLAAVLDLMPLVLAMTVSSVVWYLTAWGDGPTALLFSFAGCVFLVGQTQILESTGGFLTCVLIAFGLVFLYQFVVLPRVTDFPLLIMVLGCALVPLGVLMAMCMAGMLIATLTFSFLGLQNAYAADFSQSLQTLAGSLAGLLIAVICLRVCSYDHVRFTTRRLAAAVRRDVLEIARARRLPGRDRFRFLALYRLSLYFPAAAQASDGVIPIFVLLNDLVAGHSLLALRWQEPAVSAPARDMIKRLCRKTAATYRKKLSGRDDSTELLALVVETMTRPAFRADPANGILLDALFSLDLALGASSRPAQEHAA